MPTRLMTCSKRRDTNAAYLPARHQIPWSKLAKIIQYAPDIKRRCKFLAANKRDKEYHDAMDELNMFVQIGKNDHDDAADGITQLVMLANGATICKANVSQRTF